MQDHDCLKHKILVIIQVFTKVPVTAGLGSLKTTLRSVKDQFSAQRRPIRLCGCKLIFVAAWLACHLCLFHVLIISNRYDSTILSLNADMIFIET